MYWGLDTTADPKHPVQERRIDPCVLHTYTSRLIIIAGTGIGNLSLIVPKSCIILPRHQHAEDANGELVNPLCSLEAELKRGENILKPEICTRQPSQHTTWKNTQQPTLKADRTRCSDNSTSCTSFVFNNMANRIFCSST